MSNKLDQSLDTIMADSKSNIPNRQRRGTGRRAAVKAKSALHAPTGGVKKNTKAPKPALTAPAVKAITSGDSKIIVSNLPVDVNETLIKDFFSKAVGHVKKVLLAYGPNGRSRGEATVTFSKADSAAKAHKDYNGVNVDNRPMKIEIVGGATMIQPESKGLADRMSKPKPTAKDSQKVSVAKKDGPKPATKDTAKAGRAKKKGPRANRPKAKTAEELDAEMADYFGGEGTTASVNGAAAANGGDVMTDEVL